MLKNCDYCNIRLFKEIRKIVEDSLYALGKLHIADHPFQSLFFDVDNSASYIENNVFTVEEIQEIEAFKPPQV